MSRRILVVDDHADNRRILRDLLGSVGFEILEATTGEEAVMRAARAGHHILIPQSGFRTQWDAFLKVEQQTATLLDRSRGGMALICPE